MKAKVWILKKKFEGRVQPDNFELIEEDLPDTLNDGEFLTETLHWTVDPVMRTAEIAVGEGQCMFGEQISRVITSKHSNYPVDSIVRAFTGWRTHTLFSNQPLKTDLPGIGETSQIIKMPEMGELPLSFALGILGVPGLAAYFGFLEICKPKEGDTVLVNGAAGATGSIAGQIARIKGCKVVGSAGTDEKCKWLKDELGFDEAFNYKKVDVQEALRRAAPDGIDCYFDNVGGDFTSKALKHMKRFGRVAICGSISAYNCKEISKGAYPFEDILFKELKVEGFLLTRWFGRLAEGEKQMLQWIREGQIKYKETITKGFENMPTAFIGLFDGSNTGKAIITA